MLWKNRRFLNTDLQAINKTKGELWLYEVLRIQNQCPVFIFEHLDRLFQGFKKHHFQSDYSEEELVQVIFQLIRKTSLESGNIRIQVELTRSNFTIGQIPHRYPSERLLASGIHTSTLDIERSDPTTKIWNPEVRNLANEIIENTEVYEVLLVNQKGKITEGSRSNLFAILKDEIVTPPLEQVLPGITRQIILRLCEQNRIPWSEKEISSEELSIYGAFFISGTSPGILPIKKIDFLEFDHKHPIIDLLMYSYHKAIKQNLTETVRKYGNQTKA